MKFDNRTAFVSGANRGIGKALVQALLRRDVKKVYASARDVSRMVDFQDARVVPMTLDITNSNQVQAAAQDASDTEILFNNAGIAAYDSILSGPLDTVKRDMNTNYYGTLDMMRAFIPHLEVQSEPMIVNIVSIGAFVNFPILGGYCASKAALFSLTQGARIELAAKGIAVHSVNPGPIDTDMAKGVEMDKTSPESASNSILDNLEIGEMDIFPDSNGQAMHDVWRTDYRDLERMVSDMLQVDGQR